MKLKIYRMYSTSEIQAIMQEWREKNFLHATRTVEMQTLGVCEEAGELAHAVLKHKQGIRGYDDEKYRAEVRDAIGDMIIFAMGICSTEGWDIEDIIRETACKVLERNWNDNPEGPKDEIG